jgi:hypothetical protein
VHRPAASKKLLSNCDWNKMLVTVIVDNVIVLLIMIVVR